jgi:hypothetical protein
MPFRTCWTCQTAGCQKVWSAKDARVWKQRFRYRAQCLWRGREPIFTCKGEEVTQHRPQEEGAWQRRHPNHHRLVRRQPRSKVPRKAGGRKRTKEAVLFYIRRLLYTDRVWFFDSLYCYLVVPFITYSKRAETPEGSTLRHGDANDRKPRQLLHISLRMYS